MPPNKFFLNKFFISRLDPVHKIKEIYKKIQWNVQSKFAIPWHTNNLSYGKGRMNGLHKNHIFSSLLDRHILNKSNKSKMKKEDKDVEPEPVRTDNLFFSRLGLHHSEANQEMEKVRRLREIIPVNIVSNSNSPELVDLCEEDSFSPFPPPPLLMESFPPLPDYSPPPLPDYSPPPLPTGSPPPLPAGSPPLLSNPYSPSSFFKFHPPLPSCPPPDQPPPPAYPPPPSLRASTPPSSSMKFGSMFLNSQFKNKNLNCSDMMKDFLSSHVLRRSPICKSKQNIDIRKLHRISPVDVSNSNSPELVDLCKEDSYSPSQNIEQNIPESLLENSSGYQFEIDESSISSLIHRSRENSLDDMDDTPPISNVSSPPDNSPVHVSCIPFNSSVNPVTQTISGAVILEPESLLDIVLPTVLMAQSIEDIDDLTSSMGDSLNTDRNEQSEILSKEFFSIRENMSEVFKELDADYISSPIDLLTQSCHVSPESNNTSGNISSTDFLKMYVPPLNVSHEPPAVTVPVRSKMESVKLKRRSSQVEDMSSPAKSIRKIIFDHKIPSLVFENTTKMQSCNYAPGGSEHKHSSLGKYSQSNRFMSVQNGVRNVNLRDELAWDFRPNYKRLENGSNEFTMVCYNVLAQSLLIDNPFLYKRCEKEYLDWNYRWNQLQTYFSNINADIFTLQEVQDEHYHSQYAPFFSRFGYKSLYKKRTGGKKDGCAIFYRDTMFKLIEHSDVEYDQSDFLNRPNVGLICIFNHLKTGHNICVATTHLLFNPKRVDIRLAQMMIFFSEIERLSYVGSKDMKYCPVIFAGDMNSSPNSPVISYIENAREYFNRNLTSHGILPSAQHQGVLNIRQEIMNKSVDRSIIRERENESIHLNHSENGFKTQKSNRFSQSSVQAAGKISHQFCFQSVYNHAIPLVTTMANKYEMVDYIFYSKVSA